MPVLGRWGKWNTPLPSFQPQRKNQFEKKKEKKEGKE
jgi:hypothetical protein